VRVGEGAGGWRAVCVGIESRRIVQEGRREDRSWFVNEKVFIGWMPARVCVLNLWPWYAKKMQQSTVDYPLLVSFSPPGE